MIVYFGNDEYILDPLYENIKQAICNELWIAYHMGNKTVDVIYC